MARGNGEAMAVDCGLFKEQGLAAAGFFHFAIGNFSDFQLGGDGLRDAAELAGLPERFKKIAKGQESHILERLAERKGHERSVEKGLKSGKCALFPRKMRENFLKTGLGERRDAIFVGKMIWHPAC